MSSSWLVDKRARKQPVEETWPLAMAMYAVVILPAAAIAMVEGSAGFLFVATGLCAAHAVLVGPYGGALLNDGMANVLAAVLLLGFAARADFESVRMGYTPIHFILCLQLVKLYGRHRMRDLRTIQFISLFELLVAARWAAGLSFFPIFILSLAALLFSSMLLVTRPESGVRCRRPTRLRDLLSGLRLSGVLLLVLTVVLFASFPRFRLEAARSGLVMGRQTGFSHDVSLKEIGTMRESQNVALRAYFLDAEDPDRPILMPGALLRGKTYSHYEAGEWASAPRPFLRGEAAEFEMAQRAGRRISGQGIPVRYIRQDITLEPNKRPTLFGLYIPMQLRSDDIRGMRIRPDNKEMTRRRWRVSQPVDYRVYSMVPQWNDQALAEAGTPEIAEGWEHYWQYPDDLEDVLRETIRNIEREYEPETDLARVRAIKKYLRDPNRFSYSFNRPPYGSMDPLESFLTRTRLGSCTEFASAMVLLVRMWGMPARLVGGYKSGSRKEGSAEYIFRDSDAHAWVEVFFSDNGWVAFDPTPGSSTTSLREMMRNTEGGSGGDGLRLMPARLLRQIDGAYNTYVMNYGADQQNDMVDALRNALADLSTTMPGSGGMAGAVRGVPLLLLAVVATFALAVGLHVALGIAADKRQAAREKAAAVGGYYGEMLAELERLGLQRQPHETPREFAQSACVHLRGREHVPDQSAEAVLELTDLFCRTRYGVNGSAREDDERVARALERLRAVPNPAPQS